VLAKDVMTKDVVVVRPETAVEEIARILLERRISAVPVVDSNEQLVGIVSEGDLMVRAENDTERTSWWLKLVSSGAASAREYVKTHGTEAHHVMTRGVVTVSPETPLTDIARLLQKRQIKRVPVVDGKALVGIVSRANLLHGLASRSADGEPAPSVDDRALREAVLERLQGASWFSVMSPNVVVTDGVVTLWGRVHSEEQRKAVHLLIETTPGVKGLDDHLADNESMYNQGYI